MSARRELEVVPGNRVSMMSEIACTYRIAKLLMLVCRGVFSGIVKMSIGKECGSREMVEMIVEIIGGTIIEDEAGAASS